MTFLTTNPSFNTTLSFFKKKIHIEVEEEKRIMSLCWVLHPASVLCGNVMDSYSTMAEVKQHHSLLIRLGLSSKNHAITPIITFSSLSNHGDFHYSLKLFSTLPNPDTFLFNTLFKSFLLHNYHFPFNSIFLFYSYMLLQQYSLTPNSFTFPSLIKACSIHNALQQGKQMHAHVIKFGFGFDTFALNNLIHMYVNFGYLGDARKMFDNMPVRTVVSWTTIISGYCQWGLLDDALDVFELMPEKNSASWNAMIAGFVKRDRFREAFELFVRMQMEKVGLDKFLAATMLSACTGLGALEQGKWIHGYVERSGIELDSKLATAIVDMYCKCGCLEKALEVFNRLPQRGLSLWNCMIGGLAMHGKGEDAIRLFREMEKLVVPDSVTFVNVLSACAHSGLVEEGRYYFRYMTDVHGIEPTKEHYGCLVDLLARAGRLVEARNVIDKMPISPDASILGALLGACRIHGNVELGEQLGKRLIEVEPANSGRYVILANIYADCGKWEEVANVRKLMNDRGVKKEPGFSMIEMEGTVNEFVAGEMTHPLGKAIYAKVDEMLESIRLVGYVPDADGVLHDLFEEERENPLFYHSEKLAIAYGLLKTKRGETLHITKNLRVCKDCHQASKLISKVYDCDIIIRDRNRFHHFSKGVCSCKDYW
ncbi:putative tetratricopeptide-like helical domain, DYW domain-containing protein [Lupinus albus]|uniref:Putative tetratricopeptide-like helical domain, DYW domain-containing protein n=1 Tax=Lupinus albus TaxID=3870 RepID=A0A6A4Q883_LUPAL|nr:putative tetratricopeptide-like helical domain, DYW domain-containing protein [Lupinus albus]